MKITISGDLGSGKSTIGKALAKKWGYNFYSTGDIFRKLSAERGLDIVAGNKAGESDRSLDDAVDAMSTEIGKTEDNFIFDSRLAWHFIPDSVSLYLFCDPEIAAKRIFGAGRAEEQTETQAEMLASNTQRRKSELKRYQSLYSINLIDMSNYDIILDTSHHSPEELIEWATTAITNHRRGIYLTPKTLASATSLNKKSPNGNIKVAYEVDGWHVDKTELNIQNPKGPLVHVALI